MLYLDLTVNGTLMYSGQACFGQVVIQQTDYLPFVGALMFVDNLGLTDPEWEGLNSRYSLLYFSADTPVEIPLQAAPVQNFTCILGGQNCVFGLYDQPIDTVLPPEGQLPIGFDAGYVRQQFLAPTIVQYADDYADDYYEEAFP